MLIVPILFLGLVSFSLSAISTDYPVIAIMAINNPDNSEAYDIEKVGARYVRWIEASGGLAVVIHTWNSLEEIDEVLSKVNGVLFQGGGRDIDLSKRFEKTHAYVFNKVIEMNKQGVNFPLWTTCQGFELIHAIVANDTKVLENFSAWNMPSGIYSIKGVTEFTRMYAEFSKEDLENLEKFNSTSEFHRLGISPDAYSKYPALNDFFTITTLGKDTDEQIYIASVEAKNYPIFAPQFHPEKTPYDRAIKDNIPRNSVATKTAQMLGNAFINEAERNHRRITYDELVKFNFIDTFIQGKQNIDGAEYIFTKPKIVEFLE